MDKISFILSSHPETVNSEARKKREPRPEITARGEESSRKGWNLLSARERLFGILQETTQGNEAPGNKNLDMLRQKSEVMLDLGTLDYTTKRKEEELRSWSHYKIGLAKTLHNYNIIYIKFYRDVMKNTFQMNKASNLAYSSPKDLMESVRSTLGSMKSFVGMLQPMARVMLRMNEINMKIMQLGHEVGPAGARKVFTDLQEKIDNYPDLKNTGAEIGRDSDVPQDELNVGKYYQDWTKECLQQGLETLKYAMGSIEKHTNKMKNLSLMSKAANTISMRKKHDLTTFSLPSNFALKSREQQRIDQEGLQDIEHSLGQLGDVNRLEMDIKELMGNEMLKDPYLFASESITQASLGKEILGLDESLQISSKG